MATSISNPSAAFGGVPVAAAQDPLREARPYLEQILDMTRDIFQVEVAHEEQQDWELASEWHFAIATAAHGELELILDRHDQWHRRLVQFPAEVRSKFQLSLDIQNDQRP